MTQLDMLDVCESRHQQNPRSQEAHQAVIPRKLSLREQIFSYIARRGRVGATTEEISRALGLRYTTVSARMSELKRDGRLEKLDTRKTETGSWADVMGIA